MTSAAGFVLALVCMAIVGLAAGAALATLGDRNSHWLLPVARALAVVIAGGSFLLASAHQLAQALTP
ncbi:hypothetical protein [Streptomyces sp. NPDC046821]|uniref:hypothetical protein n=1 Tax=Streptomyces sp. NPDC046821 TaxID=3154702 RepID=UPI00340C48E4